MPSELSNKNASDLIDSNARHELFHHLLDAAPDAIIVVDEAGRIVFANLQTERIFGYQRDKLIGVEVETLLPDRMRHAHTAHRHRFVAAPKVRPMGLGLELYGKRSDGTEFPIEISLSSVHTARGVLASASIRDITDRKQTELRLRRIREHLISAVESIQAAFAIFDQQDRLVLCNSDYRALLATQGELEGRTFTELLDANLASAALDMPSHELAAFRDKYLAYHRNPSGAIDARTRTDRSLRFVERRTAEGGIVSTIWDITDDVEQEAQLRAARSVAEAANEAKTEFLASMSHELRTPLNSILGFAQLLQRDKIAPLSDRHRERVDHVVKGGDHLLRLIDDVLDLSRIEAGQISISMETVDVVGLMEEVVTTLGPMAHHAQVRLSIVAPGHNLPGVVADRTRLKQSLMNFGSNAIKYGRKGGQVHLQATHNDEAIRFSVVDDGMGIPVDKQSKLFQPFQRAGQETGPIEGTGIGLAITKRIVELMQGTVGFRSTEGQGSEFWLQLPIQTITTAVIAASAVAPHGAQLAGPDGPSFLVVYVEDNPSNIAFMQHLLADFERVELVTAPTAEIGVAIVRTRQPNVVIMDINLPGMNGFEATRLLKTWPETSAIPVIALSAAAMISDSAVVKTAGFYRYLTKPVKVDELLDALEHLLTAQRTKPI
jgi:PAS domain S-box-containing protein